MKLAIFAATVASAAAFSPASQMSSSTALKMGDARSPDGLGVDPGPLDLWDPLGLADDADRPQRGQVRLSSNASAR